MRELPGIVWKKDLDANDQVCPKCNYDSESARLRAWDFV